ncbi:right-handed parallel beta-helix repeat-containing protein [Streptomyces sp. NBC_01433]|uniref:right-handed parallel beta-helix repeat-containing protein n=1 Tax=Streptomyces sp. NBC_01433 TaxID=2903864 RepID=UPI002257AED4|nr:right-handed parallel beta-helix repeat-containing protein [Streptomyces sp. NBC_01433]MCX4680921.1 right-handed parallel beta-helix repeat-containing protein [Streptomyces sp. NBC_01433]
MRTRNITCLAAVAVITTTGLATALPSAATTAHDHHVVRPGESIQKAVDAAQPGDTVVVLPGTYRESVLITTPDLTLTGSGDRTVIMPGTTAGGTPGTTAGGTPGTAAGATVNACAKGGNGICVLGTSAKPVGGVNIRSLTVSGFGKSGIWGSWTDRLSVHKVTTEKNGTWGIAQERSTRGAFRSNTARDNGDAGIFVANTVDEEGGATDTLGTDIRDNRLTGNRIGITARRVRNLAIDDNTMTGNCSGVFVVGDESKPKAGAMTVQDNRIVANNKFCPETPRLSAIQGTGIVLTGSESTVVRNNLVQDNVGSTPLSGGIVLFKSFVGSPNTDNAISDNVVRDNRPADLANRDTGTGNTFTRNECGTSEPAGMC